MVLFIVSLRELVVFVLHILLHQAEILNNCSRWLRSSSCAWVKARVGACSKVWVSLYEKASRTALGSSPHASLCCARASAADRRRCASSCSLQIAGAPRRASSQR